MWSSSAASMARLLGVVPKHLDVFHFGLAVARGGFQHGVLLAEIFADVVDDIGAIVRLADRVALGGDLAIERGGHFDHAFIILRRDTVVTWGQGRTRGTFFGDFECEVARRSHFRIAHRASRIAHRATRQPAGRAC